MRLLLVVFVLCCIFPGVGVLVGNGLTALAPIVEAFMPGLIVIAGLYLLVKNVLK